MFDVQKVVAEEIAELQRRKEEEFRAKVRTVLGEIAKLQEHKEATEKALVEAKERLKGLSFQPIDGKIYE